MSVTDRLFSGLSVCNINFVGSEAGTNYDVDMLDDLEGTKYELFMDFGAITGFGGFSQRTHETYVKRFRQRSAESRGFSLGTPVSSHRKC
jgi:hypothetical protein